MLVRNLVRTTAVVGVFTMTSSVTTASPAIADGATSKLAAAPSVANTPLVKPPVAKIAPEVTEIHGYQLVDPYRWLRNREDPEVVAYLEAENAYLQTATAHTADLQESLFQEIVGRIQETDLSVPVRHGAYFYYDRIEEGRQYKVYCRKHGSLDAAEEVLLDLNALAEGEKYMRLGVYQVAPNHQVLAFALDRDGSEDYNLRFKDLATGELLPDSIKGVAYSFAWANDNRTVFYTLRDHARRPHRVMRHVLGTSPAEDEGVYRDDDERFYVSVGATRSRRFIVASSGSSLTSEHHVINADHPAGGFRVFKAREQGIEYDIDHHGDHIYVRTNHEAKNFRLLRTPIDDWDPAQWREVRPHRPRVKLEWIEPFADHMVVAEREAGMRRLQVIDLARGTERPIEMPESVYATFSDTNPTFDTTSFRFQYTSPVTPRTVFEYDLISGARTLLKQDEVRGGYDPDAYEAQRLFARARDGMAVPVTLVYKKGMARDGSSPCLLYGYGSYGATLDPYFSSSRLSLIDRGFIFALANIRGGGALGEGWHEDGRMLNKRSTFTDFIDVASFLVDQRFTTPERMVMQGGSAGGLLMGAVLNMRPDLFRAAVAQVPFVDVVNTMLDESIPLTVGEFEEWGNPKNQEFFEYMLSYSPYDNVEAKAYPRLLITAGLNDPRVQYWEPAKWAARLRATKIDDNLLLLKTNMGAGHGGASGRYDAYRELAFVYAFLLDAVGLAEVIDE